MDNGDGAGTYKYDGILSAVVNFQPRMLRRGNLGPRRVIEISGCTRNMTVTTGFENPERHGDVLALGVVCGARLET